MKHVNIFPQLLNATQAASYLGMSRSTFYNEVAKGFIRVHQTPARKGITQKHKQYWIKDLDNYITQHLTQSPTTELLNNKIINAG